MAHGHELAEGPAGPRGGCRAPRGQHHGVERRPAHDQGLRGGRAGARAGMLRRRRQRHRADGPRRFRTTTGQDRRRSVLHGISVRLHHRRDGCVGEVRQRAETVGRAVRAVRHPRVPRGQHRHADVRLVQEGNPFARGPAGPQVPRAGQPGPRAAEARRDARDAAGRRDLPGAAIRRDRRSGVDRSLQRPCARASTRSAGTTTRPVTTNRAPACS